MGVAFQRLVMRREVGRGGFFRKGGCKPTPQRAPRLALRASGFQQSQPWQRSVFPNPSPEAEGNQPSGVCLDKPETMSELQGHTATPIKHGRERKRG